MREKPKEIILASDLKVFKYMEKPLKKAEFKSQIRVSYWTDEKGLDWFFIGGVMVDEKYKDWGFMDTEPKTVTIPKGTRVFKTTLGYLTELAIL